VSLKKNFDKFGLLYSHGHPMPNIDENSLSVALFYQTLIDNSFIFDSSFRVEHRGLTVDESNIQEEWLSAEKGYYSNVTDFAKSGSVGGILFLEPFEIETTLSYIERMPSANELYWNGFHHATDSYIFGDINLENERSVNFDISGRWRGRELLTQIDSFYYNFSNYIFQNPKSGLKDPWHSSEVWETKGLKAELFGVSLKESYETVLWDIEQKHSLSLQAIRGVFSDGSSIPRISPHRISFESELNYNSFQTVFQLKYFDKSRFTASNETDTPSYYQMNLSLNYLYRIRDREELNIYFKGDNLTDEVGYNHISFLKNTAPVAGRQLSLGVRYSF
jgi:iron complex outermembrane receptor protein